VVSRTLSYRTPFNSGNNGSNWRAMSGRHYSKVAPELAGVGVSAILYMGSGGAVGGMRAVAAALGCVALELRTEGGGGGGGRSQGGAGAAGRSQGGAGAGGRHPMFEITRFGAAVQPPPQLLPQTPSGHGRINIVVGGSGSGGGGGGSVGRGLHSFTSQLNLSAFWGIGGARRGCVARDKGVLRGV